MHWLPLKVATEIAEVMNSSRLSNAACTCLRTNLEIIKYAHYNIIGTTDKTYNEPYMHTHKLCGMLQIQNISTPVVVLHIHAHSLQCIGLELEG